MKVFAISDLHLSGKADKPMDIFGAGWEGHFEKIKADWQERVSDEDVVLIGGDTSWGMKAEEGLFDVLSLAPLKGKKVLVRGNHDYWWSGITKLRNSLPDGFYLLQNDCVRFENIIIAGSRGWTSPGSVDYTEHDFALYQREGERFKLAFREVERVKEEGDRVFVLMHYPPVGVKGEGTLFSQLFEEQGVEKVIFGHLHGSAYYPFRQEKNGVVYYLTSCDKCKFRLTEIL